MKRYIVLEVDGDADVLGGEMLPEILRDALVTEGGPFRRVDVGTLSDAIWDEVVDGVADYAAEVYDDTSLPAHSRAVGALEGERDSILYGSYNLLRNIWDGDPPRHIVETVARAIEEGDE